MNSHKKNPNHEPDAPSERILAAALSEFASRGFHGARMQTIADAAGLNKAMLHYYFHSKENLYHEAIKTVLWKVMENLFYIFLSREPTDIRLEKIVDLYMDTFFQRPEILKIMMREVADGGEMIMKSLSELKTNLHAAKGLSMMEAAATVAADLGIELDEAVHIFISLVGMCMFSTVSRPFLTVMMGYGQSEFDRFLSGRRASIKAVIRAYWLALAAGGSLDGSRKITRD